MHRIVPFLLLAGLVVAGCARTGTISADSEAGRLAILGGATNDNVTIAQNAMAATNLTTLVAALQAADLVDLLDGADEYTVFAPTNDAFGFIDDDDLDRLLLPENKEQLQMLLKNHVVAGEVDDLTEGQVVQTVGGADYTITRSPADPMTMQIGAADIVVQDVESSNGVIHVINLVLQPEGFWSQF
jgi:uncharacterized surface protein with fasciclin (FAS1) repeats